MQVYRISELRAGLSVNETRQVSSAENKREADQQTNNLLCRMQLVLCITSRLAHVHAPSRIGVALSIRSVIFSSSGLPAGSLPACQQPARQFSGCWKAGRRKSRNFPLRLFRRPVSVWACAGAETGLQAVTGTSARKSKIFWVVNVFPAPDSPADSYFNSLRLPCTCDEVGMTCNHN